MNFLDDIKGKVMSKTLDEIKEAKKQTEKEIVELIKKFQEENDVLIDDIDFTQDTSKQIGGSEIAIFTSVSIRTFI